MHDHDRRYLPGLARGRGHAAAAQPAQPSDLKMAHSRRTMHDPDEVIARYGAAAGQRLIDAAEQGPVVLGELIARHGSDCEYSVPGISMAAHTEKALRAHGKSVDYWQARSRPVELLD